MRACQVARSRPTLATPWTVGHQAPRSMGLSRQEYWSGWPCPPPEDLPDPGIKPVGSCTAGGFFTTEPLQIPSRHTASKLYNTPTAALGPSQSPWPHSPNKRSSQARLPALPCGSPRPRDTLACRSPKTLLFNLDCYQLGQP